METPGAQANRSRGARIATSRMAPDAKPPISSAGRHGASNGRRLRTTPIGDMHIAMPGGPDRSATLTGKGAAGQDAGQAARNAISDQRAILAGPGAAGRSAASVATSKGSNASGSVIVGRVVKAPTVREGKLRNRAGAAAGSAGVGNLVKQQSAG